MCERLWKAAFSTLPRAFLLSSPLPPTVSVFKFVSEVQNCSLTFHGQRPDQSDKDKHRGTLAPPAARRGQILQGEANLPKKQNPSIPLKHSLRSTKPRSDQNEVVAITLFFCSRSGWDTGSELNDGEQSSFDVTGSESYFHIQIFGPDWNFCQPVRSEKMGYHGVLMPRLSFWQLSPWHQSCDS